MTWTLLLAPTMRAVTVRATTQTDAVLAAPCRAGETVAVVLARMAPAGAERSEG